MTGDRRGYTVSMVVRRHQRKTAPSIGKPADVFRLMRPRLKNLDRERFYAILMDTRNSVLAVELVSIGSLNASIVHPREILKPAITSSAASIILVHNHPTGDPEPSSEDLEFTRRFAKCGRLIGIELLDHVIMGDRGYISLKERDAF